MPATLDQITQLAQALTTDDVAYSAAGSIVTATVAGDPFVVAELDGQARTFRFRAVKNPQSNTRTPSFEAGGVYNLAKRSGLVGHKPSQLRVKATLAELFTRNGWTKVR
ncbi:MAG: hypothetical protein WA006_00610 [Rhodoglobus sp.]